ncbi:tetratricopeptide repeat protein [bacterium SCSIO 12643]|nr:tetratricopeptide repeat protein [bacterium SCSIO 12643]
MKSITDQVPFTMNSSSFLFKISPTPYLIFSFRFVLIFLIHTLFLSTSIAQNNFSDYYQIFQNIPSQNEDSALLLFNEALLRIQNDSYHKKIQTEEANLRNAQCHLALATWYTDHSSIPKSLKYSNKGLEYLSDLKGTTTEAELLNNLLDAYHQNGKMDSVQSILNKTLEHKKFATDSLASAIDLITIGTYSITQGKTDTAIILYERSLDILNTQNSPYWKAACLRLLANRNNKLGNIDKTLLYLDQSLEIQKDLNHKVNEAKTLIQIGAIYGEQSKPDIALKYFDDAQKLNNELRNLEIQAKIYHRKANLYSSQNNCSKSLEFHQKSLNLVIENQMSPWVIPMCQSNIAQQYTCLGDYTKALHYINLSLDNGDKVGFPTFYALNLYRKGNIYRELHDYPQASKYLREALNIYQEIKHLVNIERVSRSLSEVLFEQGQSTEAYKLLQVSNQLKDSLSENKIEKLIVEKDKRFALEQSRQKAELQAAQITHLEEEKNTERIIFITLIILFIALLVIVYLGINNFKQRKAKEEIENRSKIELYQKEMDLLRMQVSSLLQESKNTTNQPFELDSINNYLQTPLTGRELDVLTQLSQGKSNSEIGEILFVSVNTVGTHLKNIYSKLEVNNRVQAVKVATSLTHKAPHHN